MRALTLIAAAITSAASVHLPQAPGAAPLASASCDALLPPPRMVSGTTVGPSSCLWREADITYGGRQYVRFDLGLSGTVEGYVTPEGAYHEYLTNAPDLIFAQAGTPGPRRLAIARYDRNKGAAVLLVVPRSVADWNGKLWVTAHGRGRSFRNGRLQTWDRYYDPADPLAAFDKIDRGGPAAADGQAPVEDVLYGHSAGARIGRSLNYAPGLNVDHRGGPAFDGFLLDDAATGLWLPVVRKDGRDVLFSTAAERDAFRPQVELVHQMYNKIWERAPGRPSWLSSNYLANKRLNARILIDKGWARSSGCSRSRR